MNTRAAKERDRAIAGSCFCGRVRYEIYGQPFNATLCHCRDCQRVTGAPAVGWLSCRPSELVFVGTEPKRFVSSCGVTRGFCADCGTALTYARDDLPDEVDVTIASLDRPDEVIPNDQTFCRQRLAWLDGIATLPEFSSARSDGSSQVQNDRE